MTETPANLDARILRILRASPVFGSLDEAALVALSKSFQVRHVPGGQYVLQEGEASDSMFFLLSGRLRVSRRAKDGSSLMYNEIQIGESVGEMAMILQQPRTADVSTLRDSTLAVLERSAFEELLQQFPLPINKVFSQAIYAHLRHKSQVADQRNVQSFAVVPLHDGPLGRDVARSLTLAFGAMGRAHHIEPEKLAQTASATLDLRQAIELHSRLEDQFEYLIYEGDHRLSPATLTALRQADQVIFAIGAGQSREIGAFEAELLKEPGLSMKRQHLVVQYPPTALHPSPRQSWRAAREIERVYPVRNGNASDFESVTRFLTGTAVGVVLGGGGARGFAHLGILRALQESGVPIDVIGGNSMGALIAAQFAAGKSLDAIRLDTQIFAAGGERPTLPLISLVSGKRVARDLERMFEGLACDGLWRPFFAAACNLSRGCTTVQDVGPMWRAVLASNSPAGLFPPVVHEGELLVDGAILENVPVAAMRGRLGTPLERRRGNGSIIAIDVDVAQDLVVPKHLLRLSVWQSLKDKLARRADPTPSIADILYRAGHIGGLYQRGQTIAQADHYLEPPVGAYAMMAYKSAEEIADVGYRYAAGRIRQWTLPLRPRA